MNEHVKNQHYVPQFLLKNFSSRDRKFIWAYDKEEKYDSNPIKERPIKKVASEDFFYDQIRNSNKGSYEYVLQKVEDYSAPIIRAILETKSINRLSENDRKTLSLFIIVQHLRTKGQLLKTEYFSDLLHERLEQKANIEIDKIDPKKLWLSFMEDSIVFYNIINEKVWMLSESDESFYIGDDPVVLQNSTDLSEIRGTLGLDSFGIEIYLPLSHSLTLCMFCEKMFKKSGYNHKYIDNLICQPENVENLNSLQVANSHRFIFSHENNFDKVKNQLEMMKKM